MKQKSNKSLSYVTILENTLVSEVTGHLYVIIMEFEGGSEQHSLICRVLLISEVHNNYVCVLVSALFCAT